MEKEFCSWEYFEKGVEQILNSIKQRPGYIIAIPRGGLILGVRLSHELDVPLAVYGTDSIRNYNPREIGLLVDDISDTGDVLLTTSFRLCDRKLNTAALYIKSGTHYIPTYYAYKTEKWVVFPWERKEADSVKASWKF